MIEEARPLVLHVIHHLVIGGMENGLVNLLNRMRETRFHHAIACIEDYSDFRSRLRRADVEVFPLYRSRVGIWKTRRAIFRLCRRIRPAVVHTRNMSGLDALLPARLAGVPRCIHGEHGWDVSELGSDHWKPALLRRLHRPLVDRYVTVSRHLEHYLVDRIGVPAARVIQIYNGVDTERFAPAMRKPADVLPRDFRADGCVVIGTVGRIQSVKDHATLVRAFAELLHMRADPATNLRLAIVGAGPLLDDVRRLVVELGIESRVWMPGAVDDVPNILRAFDVFVLPSLAEGISNTILEAMATGLPVVATAVGGNVEIVDDDRTGRLFRPGDSAALARIIARYADNSSLRQTHGRRGREAAVDRFSLTTMVERYEAMYAEMTAAPSSGGHETDGWRGRGSGAAEGRS